jgi:hypothetical protein
MNVLDFAEDPGAVEAAQIQRRMQLAQMIASQGMNGAPVYSNKAAVAKALQGMLGSMEVNNAEKAQRELAQRRSDEKQQEMAGIIEAAQAGEGKRGELAKLLAGSKNPAMQQAGLKLMMEKPEQEAYTLPEGGRRYKGDKLIAENPKPVVAEKEPEAIRTMRASMTAAGIDPASPQGQQIFDAYLKKQTTHQPATNVQVNTGKKFGETLATEVAQQVAQSSESARGAVDTLNTAKQIEAALASGKVMAGPGTSGLMWVQQAIGAPSTEEGRVKTREVIQGLSQMTLAARKSLKGQGQVSDFEGKLLAKAASGDIDNLTIPEIQALTKTAVRLANGSITQHQAYLKKIQSDPELKGLAPFFDINAPAADSNPTADSLVNKYRSPGR